MEEDRKEMPQRDADDDAQGDPQGQVALKKGHAGRLRIDLSGLAIDS